MGNQSFALVGFLQRQDIFLSRLTVFSHLRQTMDKNTLSVHRCHPSGYANWSAFFYCVGQHMCKCSFREHCVEKKLLRLGKEERSALPQSHECGSSIENGEVAEIANELEGEKRLQIAIDGKRTVPDFRFLFCQSCSTVHEKRRKT